MKARAVVFWFSVLLAGASHALEQTPTGFYYPIGTGSYQSGKGWFLSKDPDYFANLYHIGVDMMTRSLTAKVYAIADGQIFNRSCKDLDWGTGNCGVLVCHTTSSGKKFTALYGHVSKNSLPSGNTVTAGKDFATTGPWGNSASDIHLHFGIRWGCDATPSPWGRLQTTQWKDPCEGNDACTNGFVDPIDFIRRTEPYVSGDDTKTVVVRKVGNYAWYPAESSCILAKAWYYFDQYGQISTRDSRVCQAIFQGFGQSVDSAVLFGESANVCYQR